MGHQTGLSCPCHQVIHVLGSPVVSSSVDEPINGCEQNHDGKDDDHPVHRLTRQHRNGRWEEEEHGGDDVEYGSAHSDGRSEHTQLESTSGEAFRF